MPRSPIPSYRRQRRANGKDAAFVEVRGQRRYLGAYGSEESRQAYARLIGELKAGHALVQTSPDVITITELVARFWEYSQTYYRRPDGTTTSEVANYRIVLRPLVALYGSTPAASFGPKAMKVVRTRMIEIGWCRTNVNASVSRIRHVFRWAAENEILPATVYQALQTVAGLKRGRCDARESEPRTPVRHEDIDACKPYLSHQIVALIDLQLLTGARAGELVVLRPIDLDMGSDVWRYCLSQHKTAHHGRTRTIYIGPAGQRILSPFLATRPIDAFVFSPREAETERYASAQTHRRDDPASESQENETHTA